MLNRLSLNKLSLNRIDLNRIGGRDVGVSARPYIDPELLSHVKMAISTWGKSNDDPDRTVLKDLSGNGNDMRLLNFGFTGNSGYGLYEVNFMDWTKYTSAIISLNSSSVNIVNNTASNATLYRFVKVDELNEDIPSLKIKVSGSNVNLVYQYIRDDGELSAITIKESKEYTLPISHNSLFNGSSKVWTGFFSALGCNATIEQIPDFEGWLCTDGVDDMIESVKPVSEMLEGSNEITVVSIIHYFDTASSIVRTNFAGGLGSEGNRWKENRFDSTLKGKTGIYGWSSKDIDSSQTDVINNILGDKNDYKVDTNTDSVVSPNFSVVGFRRDGIVTVPSKIVYAGGFIANKVLTTDEINQIIAYYNLDRPGQIIKPQLYCNVKKQGITNDNHAEFNDQLIDFVGDHNIQLNNISWEGESGIIDGALYLDGISDFGKVTGLPAVKDYTVVAEREIPNNNPESFGLISDREIKNNIELNTFVFEKNRVPYAISFGMSTSVNRDDSLKISYQSKYSYNGESIVVGDTTGNNILLLGAGLINNDIIKEYVKAAVRFLMLFPYSLSEFLLERQLRKYKAGTLYPDMIEFRPIVKSNIPYSSISYSVNPGEYIAEGSMITITITLSNASDKLIGVSSNAISDISISGDNGIYEITGKVTKSPQKISIVISSYLTMLNNETLISNETLIKNNK